VHRTVVEALDELSSYRWRLEPMWLVVSGLLYLAGLAPAAVFWHGILRALGQRPAAGETWRAYYVGHVAKYVPGKALVIVLRTGLITSARVDARLAAVSVFYETLGMMGVGSLVAAALVAWRFRDQAWLAGVALLVAAAVLLPTLPPVLSRLLRFGRLARLDPAMADAVARITMRRLVAGWFVMTPGWLVMGLSVWATLRAVAAPGLEFPGDWPLCTLSVALAIVAGFLAMVPGGAIVREAVLMELMVPRFGEATALVSAIVLRLVFLVSEVVISTILYLYLKWFAPSSPREPPPPAVQQSPS
jgi:uncharacterized membrane protein YbhN (UPF0104 family)